MAASKNTQTKTNYRMEESWGTIGGGVVHIQHATYIWNAKKKTKTKLIYMCRYMERQDRL